MFLKTQFSLVKKFKFLFNLKLYILKKNLKFWLQMAHKIKQKNTKII